MLERVITEGRILVVEDEPGNVRIMERVLAHAGYRAVVSALDPREAPDLFSAFQPDLVLLDLHMPHVDGFGVMGALATRIPEDEYLPILVLTGDQDPELRRKALAVGAKDFVTKPFEVTEVVLRIKNLLETRFLHLQLRKEKQHLEDKVVERTAELSEARFQILRRLAAAAEYRDDVTGQHAERVGILSARIAGGLGMGPEEVTVIRHTAPLHDVGKIGIPDAILMKPGKLTPQEFAVMKRHTQIGARILSGSRFPLLRTAETIALTHHERWDGGGYNPDMRGEQIPLAGRIVAVADVFDSLTHERPYKMATPLDEAVEEIVRGRGSHFDPDIVDVFVDVIADGVEGLEKVAERPEDGGVVDIFDHLRARDMESRPAPDLRA